MVCASTPALLCYGILYDPLKENMSLQMHALELEFPLLNCLRCFICKVGSARRWFRTPLFVIPLLRAHSEGALPCKLTEAQIRAFLFEMSFQLFMQCLEFRRMVRKWMVEGKDWKME